MTMNRKPIKLTMLVVAALSCLFTSSAKADETVVEKVSTEDRAFFEKEVRPLLVKRCFECHGGSEAEGGLSLASAEGWKHGGDSGPAIVPGKPDESYLIEAINYESWEMPPAERVASFPMTKSRFSPNGSRWRRPILAPAVKYWEV